jgi:hypothetical protein
MRSAHSRTVRKTPVRLMSMTALNWSSVILRLTFPVSLSVDTIIASLMMPAKGATRLILPNRSIAASASLPQSSSLVTLQTTERTSPPMAFNCDSAFTRNWGATSAMTALPPFCTQYRAISRPMPPPPPVITATAFLISSMLISSLIFMFYLNEVRTNRCIAQCLRLRLCQKMTGRGR